MTGQACTIFEAVTNKIDTTGDIIKKNPGKWYISPVCAFPLPAKIPTPIINGGKAIYSLKMTSFNLPLIQNAAAKINGSLIGFQIPLNNVESFVGLMPIQKLSISIPDEDLRIQTISLGNGSPGEKVSLSQDVSIELKVPIENREAFEDRVASTNGLPCQASILYNVLNLKKQLIKFTGLDIQNTSSYNKLNQQGAEVVNAAQVQDMLIEVSRSKNWAQFEDPGMHNKLSDKSFDIFVKMINSMEEQKAIDTAAASAMDERIRKGTGLSSDEFKPITLMREVVSKIQDVTDYKQANAIMNSEYEASKEKWDVSASAGWGPFSASVGYSKENQTAKSSFFSNNAALKQFQDKYIETKGPDAIFKMRGIHLLDTGKFQAKLASLAEMVSFEPSVQSAPLTITSKLQVNTGANEERYQYLPVGSIVAYGGDKAQLPKNWAVCNGDEVESAKYPVLAQKLNTLWGAATSGKVKLPDLRGYFLRGVDDGSGRDPDTSRTVGSVQQDATRKPNTPFLTGDEVRSPGQPRHHHQDPTYNNVVGPYELAGSSAGITTWHFDYGAQSAPTSEATPHYHAVESGGDSETRPKNADVFWIIKLK